MILDTITKIPTSIRSLIDQLEEKRTYNPSDIVKIVKSADVQEEDLLQWADFDHPAADSYGRKLVHKSPNFEVMVMSWRPGDISAIHDHGYTTWGAVKVFGPQEHATFRVEDNKIQTLTRANFQTGQVVGVGHSLIHQMGNYTNENVLTLHVYGLEDDKDEVTGDARLYLPETGEIQIIKGGVFYDLPADEIVETIQGPVGDFPTRLRDNIELANRMIAQGKTGFEIDHIKTKITSLAFLSHLLDYLNEITDENRHV